MSRTFTLNEKLDASAKRTIHNLNMGATDKFKQNVVYQIDFSNGEVYVGSTVKKLTQRISNHVDAARNGRQHTKLAKALIKHNFGGSVKILDMMLSQKNLRSVEMHHIAIAKLKYGEKLLNIKMI